MLMENQITRVARPNDCVTSSTTQFVNIMRDVNFYIKKPHFASMMADVIEKNACTSIENLHVF